MFDQSVFYLGIFTSICLDWAAYESDKKDHKLEEVVETVESAEMPVLEYTWTHKEARLTDDQRQALIEWAEKTRLIYQLDRRPE